MPGIVVVLWDILQSCEGCGYKFLWRGCVMFHPNIIENPVSLSSIHPLQGCMSYDEYVKATQFHYTM